MAHQTESYHILFESRIAWIRLEGNVTMEGILVASEALYSADAWRPSRPELWDLTEIDSLSVTPESLRAVAAFEGDRAEIVGPGRTAMAVSSEDAYDIGLLYSHLPKGNGREHRTFRELSAARSWLEGA